jgi:hypothetical protein
MKLAAALKLSRVAEDHFLGSPKIGSSDSLEKFAHLCVFTLALHMQKHVIVGLLTKSSKHLEVKVAPVSLVVVVG